MEQQNNIYNILKPKSRADITRDLSKLSQAELNDKLISASRNGHKDVVSMLLQAGAQVDAKDTYGWTALMWASSRNGYKDIVSMLLQAGAQVDAKDNDGWTALMLASRNGYKDVVKVLKKHGVKE